MLSVIVVAFVLTAQPGDLDRCLGDRAAPLDAKHVERAWRALASGKRAPTLPPLRTRGAGQCVTSWWSPVEPEHACGPDGRRWRLLPMGDAGTVIVDANKGKWSWRDKRDDVMQVGNAVLVR